MHRILVFLNEINSAPIIVFVDFQHFSLKGQQYGSQSLKPDHLLVVSCSIGLKHLALSRRK